MSKQQQEEILYNDIKSSLSEYSDPMTEQDLANHLKVTRRHMQKRRAANEVPPYIPARGGKWGAEYYQHDVTVWLIAQRVTAPNQ